MDFTFVVGRCAILRVFARSVHVAKKNNHVWDSGKELVPGVTRHLEGECVGTPDLCEKLIGNIN